MYSMRKINYLVYKEGEHYVSQCLNVDVSSFGDTIEEAVENLKEAVDLYCEDDSSDSFQVIGSILIGESSLSAKTS